MATSAQAPARVRIARRRIDGVLLLDKPSGLSSNTALQRARWLLQAEKAGHTGTLDPLASGLLPVCLGEATKFSSFLLDATKAYRATIRFGVTTDTGDAEGRVLAHAPVAFDEAALREALERFHGPIVQVPPRHAALKFEGRPYYRYAREGIDIPRPARDVVIHALDLVEWTPPDALLDVTCSKGTYIRVLAEDLGAALGSGAHLAALRRTATGGFGLAGAVTLDELEALPLAERDATLLPAEVLVAALPRLVLEAEAAARFRHGAAVPAAGLPEGPCAVFQDRVLAGVADVRDGTAQPRRVVASAGGAPVPSSPSSP